MLWAYLLGIDLIDEVAQPTNGRSTRPSASRSPTCAAHRVRDVWDEQWLRLLDVDAALRARAVSPRRPVGGDRRRTIRGSADNVGTWRVEASGAKRADAAPDLEVAIDVLSAAFLGGTSWRELADPGHVGVHRPAAVDEADTLFAEHPAPFCGTFYWRNGRVTQRADRLRSVLGGVAVATRRSRPRDRAAMDLRP